MKGGNDGEMVPRGQSDGMGNLWRSGCSMVTLQSTLLCA